MDNLVREQWRPSHDEIAQAAYQIWEQRGCPQGCDVEFWLEAEQQIRSTAEPSREEFTAPPRSPDALAVQSQPSQTAAKSATTVRSRTGKQAATASQGEVKQAILRTTIPSVRRPKTEARAGASR